MSTGCGAVDALSTFVSAPLVFFPFVDTVLLATFFIVHSATFSVSQKKMEILGGSKIRKIFTVTQLERILKMNLFFPFQTNNYGKFSFSSIDTRRQFYAFKAHNNERRQLNERQRENRSIIGNNWFLIIFSYVWNMVANEKASRENIKHLTKRQDRSTYEHLQNRIFQYIGNTQC